MQRARPRDWASTQTRVDRYAGSRLTGAMPKLSQTAHAIRPGVFSELERAISERRAAGGDLVPLHIVTEDLRCAGSKAYGPVWTTAGPSPP